MSWSKVGFAFGGADGLDCIYIGADDIAGGISIGANNFFHCFLFNFFLICFLL